MSKRQKVKVRKVLRKTKTVLNNLSSGAGHALRN